MGLKIGRRSFLGLAAGLAASSVVAKAAPLYIPAGRLAFGVPTNRTTQTASGIFLGEAVMKLDGPLSNIGESFLKGTDAFDAYLRGLRDATAEVAGSWDDQVLEIKQDFIVGVDARTGRFIYNGELVRRPELADNLRTYGYVNMKASGPFTFKL